MFLISIVLVFNGIDLNLKLLFLVYYNLNIYLYFLYDFGIDFEILMVLIAVFKLILKPALDPAIITKKLY